MRCGGGRGEHLIMVFLSDVRRVQDGCIIHQEKDRRWVAQRLSSDGLEACIRSL